MKIVAVRHTSVAVEPGICYGHMDVLPDKNFSVQAAKVKNRIANIKFDDVYSSPSQRCQLLSKYLGYTPYLSDKLMELNFGDWEGMSWNAIYGTEEGKKWFDDYIETPCPGGESYREMLHRVNSFLEQLLLQHLDTVLIFTHAGVIRALYSIIDEISVEEAFSKKIDYAGVVEFQIL